MAVAADTEIGVRQVTDEEVEAFHENGWVLLRNLIAPEVAGQLRQRAERAMQAAGETADTEWYETYKDPSKHDELFRKLCLTETLGYNTSRLLGRESSIRLFFDFMAVKRPVSDANGLGEGTQFHQDGIRPFDRNTLSFWIALDEVRPEQGPMQFYNGSHKLGLLGHLPRTESLSPKMWPRLSACPLSEPNHLKAGDATAHINWVVHGTPENASDRSRWAYIVVCFPGDSRLVNPGASPTTAGPGFEMFQQIDDPKFPLIYSPPANR